MLYKKEIHFTTKLHIEFVDITDSIQDAIRDSGIHEGVVFVFVPHTTMGVVINHNEPLLLQDISRILNRFAPMEDPYTHDLFELRRGRSLSDGRSNGHSHCKAILLGSSETIPFSKGKLVLGKKQSVFVVELDGSRKRNALIQIFGE